MMNQYDITNLLLDKACIKYISSMTKDQLDDAFGHEFSILKNYDQNNPHHDRDLFAHTLGVLEGVQSLKVSVEDRLTLSLAALLHDIGKPETAALKQNRTVFYGHPAASRDIADKLLHAYGFSENMIQRVLFFICYHDTFISFKLPSELVKRSNPHLKRISKDTVTKQIQVIQTESETNYHFCPTMDDFHLLIDLCISDASAQAEIVFQNGIVIDTRQNKLARFHAIRDMLPKPD